MQKIETDDYHTQANQYVQQTTYMLYEAPITFAVFIAG